MLRILLLLFLSPLFWSCSPAARLARSARETVLNDSALLTAHVGIAVYDAETNAYLFNYQGDKYFVPASNTKLPTCYAAMKYLGDSLVGLRYAAAKDVLLIRPGGDPGFLLEEFREQPVFSFLKESSRRQTLALVVDPGFQAKRWGSGWSWNDYDAAYMAERSAMPIYGNVVTVRLKDSAARFVPDAASPAGIAVRPFTTGIAYFDRLVNDPALTAGLEAEWKKKIPQVAIGREIGSNRFYAVPSRQGYATTAVPFVAGDSYYRLLQDTVGGSWSYAVPGGTTGGYRIAPDGTEPYVATPGPWKTIHSRPTDSLLKPMMHRSDNFFAEQCLLMAGSELLGVMNEARLIDTLLKTDFRDLPQRPRWVDGSGLSRYNLFTPQDLVQILKKMKDSFGMERIREILPTGNEGTLTGYYKAAAGSIYAKTGTLSGVVALSGFLYTRSNRLLIFSVLVNNHQASASAVRRAVERFIETLR